MGNKERCHNVSYWLKRIAEESIVDTETNTTLPKSQIIAKKIFKYAMAPDTSIKDFIPLVSLLLDRLEGKPIQTNINSEIVFNPFENIDTDLLESLKKKLSSIQAEIHPQIENDKKSE